MGLNLTKKKGVLFIDFCTEQLSLRAFISVLPETWMGLDGSVLVCVQFPVTCIAWSDVVDSSVVRYLLRLGMVLPSLSLMNSGVLLMSFWGLCFFFFSMCI